MWVGICFALLLGVVFGFVIAVVMFGGDEQ